MRCSEFPRQESKGVESWLTVLHQEQISFWNGRLEMDHGEEEKGNL